MTIGKICPLLILEQKTPKINFVDININFGNETIQLGGQDVKGAESKSTLLSQTF